MAESSFFHINQRPYSHQTSTKSYHDGFSIIHEKQCQILQSLCKITTQKDEVQRLESEWRVYDELFIRFVLPIASVLDSSVDVAESRRRLGEEARRRLDRLVFEFESNTIDLRDLASQFRDRIDCDVTMMNNVRKDMSEEQLNEFYCVLKRSEERFEKGEKWENIDEELKERFGSLLQQLTFNVSANA